MGFEVNGVNPAGKGNGGTNGANNSNQQQKQELKLIFVDVKNPDAKYPTTFTDTTGNTNYYRATTIFGDIASKKEQYPDQPFVESALKKETQKTKDIVEDVTVKVDANFDSETARDLKAFDIAAKPAGVGGFTEMFAKGKGTDAYNLFLEVNADDFTVRETEYKGKTESNAYLDMSKSDGSITVFGSEIIDGKEYLTMRDKDGKVHYFDPKNDLKENPDLN
ncbi:hypothetical protein J6A34_08800 [bacterium]|nr:hypothetical protein [bacterium]